MVSGKEHFLGLMFRSSAQHIDSKENNKDNENDDNYSSNISNNKHDSGCERPTS